MVGGVDFTRGFKFKAAGSSPLAALFSERPPPVLEERPDHICVAPPGESQKLGELENVSVCVFRARNGRTLTNKPGTSLVQSLWTTC